MTTAGFKPGLRTASFGACAGAVVFLLLTSTALAEAEKQTRSSPPDTSITMPGGQEGAVFKDLVVEGEDLVQVEFERPELKIVLDPQTAPGLQWGSLQEVLDRTRPDLASPLVGFFAYEHFCYRARPWLNLFASEDLVHFRPSVRDLDRWQLTIANSRGETVASFQGKGKPPEEIGWNGVSLNGKPAPPGLTYSYVFEAFDRAGNKRSFVGEGFELPPYCVQTKDGFAMLFSGRDLSGSVTSAYAGPAMPAPILLDVANRISQSGKVGEPIRVEATARSTEKAKTLAESASQTLSSLVLNGRERIQSFTQVETDAPAEGTIRVVVSR